MSPPIGPDEDTLVTCLVCKGRKRVLTLVDRPGGPPGNAWGTCPGCGGVGMVSADTQARQRLRWPEKNDAQRGQ